MIPNAILVRTRLVRGAIIWVTARALLSLGLSMAGGDPIRLGAPASLAFVAICVAASTIDEIRMGESVLVANLGVSRAWCVMVDVMPPLVGELVIHAAGVFLA